MGMPSIRTNNFPESGRGLGHVTPSIFGSTVGYPSDSLASCSRGDRLFPYWLCWSGQASSPLHLPVLKCSLYIPMQYACMAWINQYLPETA